MIDANLARRRVRAEGFPIGEPLGIASVDASRLPAPLRRAFGLPAGGVVSAAEVRRASRSRLHGMEIAARRMQMAGPALVKGAGVAVLPVTVFGAACHYNRVYPGYSGTSGIPFQFAPNCFSPDSAGVTLLSRHSRSRKPVASTRGGTLRLVDTPDALFVMTRRLPDTPWTRAFVAEIELGTIRALSVGIEYDSGDATEEMMGGQRVRTLHKATLHHVAACERGAATSAYLVVHRKM